MAGGTSRHLRRSPAGGAPHASPPESARAARGAAPRAVGVRPVRVGGGRHGRARHRGGRRTRPPRRGIRRTVSNVLIVVGVVLLLVAGGLWGFAQLRYHEANVQNERLAAYATVYDDASQAPQIDWEGLKAINPDVVGWLYVPGTTIDYPVYQSTDNEYYLRHSATGDWLVSGQVFMDYQNTAPGMVDQQSIIYGHHMLDGTMFEQIAAMDDQATFDGIGTIWYVTEQGACELEPLLLYYTRADNQDVRRFGFDSPDAFHSYLQGLLGDAVTMSVDASQVIAGTDHVLSLVTCNYYRDYYLPDGTNGRTVLVCVPKAEAAAARAASGG